jgi:hypothetical protein
MSVVSEYADFYDYSSSYPSEGGEEADSEVNFFIHRVLVVGL